MYDLKDFWFSKLENKREEVELILTAHGLSFGFDYNKQPFIPDDYVWIAYVPSNRALFLYTSAVSQSLFESSGFKYIPTEYLLSL